MKLFFSVVLLQFALLELLAARSPYQSSWQQRADFSIRVKLSPDSHTITGDLDVVYQNNSPQKLKHIYFHIWPNAYKNSSTAFAKQSIRTGKTNVIFAKEEQRGWMDGLNFEADGKNLIWLKDSTNEDVIILELPFELETGQSIKINSKFVVKLPDLFSRSGVHEDFFAITQWYPKPAVYDVNGWNAMPYLDQGEFYSEFGNYHVEIQVPDSFDVAATGNLLKSYDSLNQTFYVYEENDIHDFAWFVSKDFNHSFRNIKLSSGAEVKLEVYGYKESDFDSTGLNSIETAIRKYSKYVGEYPYRTCKVVIGPLKAGEGMEYPTITVCNDFNKETIIHEVGHNWFYGILASNERMHPWMDESVNSYFDKRITNEFDSSLCRDILKDSSFFSGTDRKGKIVSHPANFILDAIERIHHLQAINLNSEEFTSYNYGAILYMKGPLAFAYLNEMIGDELFLKCFKEYYDTWKFRHPLPGDMQKSFEKTCGYGLDWFFKDVLGDINEIDIKETRKGIEVFGSDSLSAFVRRNSITDPNAFGFLYERNYANNRKDINFMKFHFPLGLPANSSKINVNISPFAGYNIYDGVYPMMILSNAIFNRNRFEFSLVPAYSVKRDQLIGYGKLALKNPMKGAFDLLELGIQGQSFGIETVNRYNNYYRVNPFVKLRFKRQTIRPDKFESFIKLSAIHTGLVQDKYFTIGDTFGNIYERLYSSDYFFNYLRLSYELDNHNSIDRIALNWNTEYGYNNRFNPGSNQYLKTWMNLIYKHQYLKGKYFRSELFAGAFIKKSGKFNSQQFFMSSNGGNTDYTYSEVLMGRSESFFSDLLIGRQIIENGGLRNILYSFSSDRWMITMKNDIQFPGALPLYLYLDLGYSKYDYVVNAGQTNETHELKTVFGQTAGIQVSLFGKILDVFVPLYSSKIFKDFNQINTSFVNTIGFRLHLNRLDPVKAFNNVSVFGTSGIKDNP